MEEQNEIQSDTPDTTNIADDHAGQPQEELDHSFMTLVVVFVGACVISWGILVITA